jgi:hypothetical protein
MHIVASQRAYNATSFLAGQDRATGIFTLVGKRLPFVKIAVHASASTGALSDASSNEAEQKAESSTGATEKMPEPAEVEKMSQESVEPQKSQESVEPQLHLSYSRSGLQSRAFAWWNQTAN